MEFFSNKVGYVKLQNSSSELTIDSDFGALPLSWKVEGVELLFCPENHRETVGKRMCGIPLMYPFANRINPEILTIPHRPSMPLNGLSGLLRDANQTIMHGLLLWKDGWTVGQRQDNSVTYSLDWNTSFWGYSYLPVNHLIHMTFTISDHALQIQMNIENRDSIELPLCFGFHPYFLIDRSADSDSVIQIPSDTFNQTDEKLFPTGIKAHAGNLLQADGSCQLGSVVLDTCFVDLFLNENQQVVTTLKTPTVDLQISMDAAFKNLIVYLPPDKVKPYICIEPMMAATNEWHSQSELRLLKGGESFKASFEIRATIHHK